MTDHESRKRTISYLEEIRTEARAQRKTYRVIALDEAISLLKARDLDLTQGECESERACQHRDDGRGRCIDCGAFL